MTQAPQASKVAPQAELFAHGADIGVRGIGPTPATAFEQAALALTRAVTDPARIAPQTAIDIVCEAPNENLLLVDWLNALIYEMAVRKLVFGRFAVEIRDRGCGPGLGRAGRSPRDIPLRSSRKGATLTALKVAKRDDGAWVAQCVVDV